MYMHTKFVGRRSQLCINERKSGTYPLDLDLKIAKVLHYL